MFDAVVILGAAGDLTGRLLLPALASLHAEGGLPDGFRVIGADRTAWTSGGFAAHARAELAEHASFVAARHRDELVGLLRFVPADAGVEADVAAVLATARTEAGAGPIVVYLALPTQLMLPAARALGAAGLPAGSRIAVEKPFGHDARSAAELEDALATVCDRARASLLRVDHVLAMTAVQRLPQARVPGTDIRIDWSSAQLAGVDLLFEETLALEGRASFYDRAGALRDVVQNHLVQLLCTVAAASDATGATDPARRREEVLRAVRPLTAQDVRHRSRRARYTAGQLAETAGAGGRTVPDYVAQDGVDPARDTETFAEFELAIDTPQWVGTRFVLRAGKALHARRRGVRLHLRADADAGGTVVWLDLDDAAEDATGGAEPAAYRRVVAELLRGGSTLGVSAAEVALAWQVCMPVLRAWAANEVPMQTYPAGSAGP